MPDVGAASCAETSDPLTAKFEGLETFTSEASTNHANMTKTGIFADDTPVTNTGSWEENIRPVADPSYAKDSPLERYFNTWKVDNVPESVLNDTQRNYKL